MSLLPLRRRYDGRVRIFVFVLGLSLAACDGDLRFAADPLPDATSDDTAAADAATDAADASGEAGNPCLGVKCPDSTLHCDPTNGTCVPCVNDSHCSGDYRRCDLATHRCVECGVDGDCESYEKCDPGTRRCRPKCGDAGSCSDLMVCDTAKGFCGCTEETCEKYTERRICSPTTRLCVQCLSNSDCVLSDERYCFEGYCVHCTSDAQCPSKHCEPVTHQCVD